VKKIKVGQLYLKGRNSQNIPKVLIEGHQAFESLLDQIVRGMHHCKMKSGIRPTLIKNIFNLIDISFNKRSVSKTIRREKGYDYVPQKSHKNP
jgi:hypothetical protein